MKLHYNESRHTMTPEKALQFLKEGNARFVNNLRINRDHLEMLNITSKEQFPFACILSCSDSRTSTELIFDQGLGDVFSVRLAGNIASIDAIASLEYSCKVLGSKLIVILGHTGCGAIKAVCDEYQEYNIKYLLDHIKLALQLETETDSERNSSNETFVNNITRLNLQIQKLQVINKSPLLNTMISSGEVGVVTGVYDLNSGKVTFLMDEQLYNLEVEAHQSYLSNQTA